MIRTRLIPAGAGRLGGMVLAIGLCLGAATTARAQDTATPKRVFGSDAGMVLNFIKPDKTADFEEVIGKLREALQKSDDPVRQRQAKSWKVFKSTDPAANNTVLYVFFIDPAVPDADYTVSTILAAAFPTEVQDLYKKYVDAYASGQNFVNLKMVSDFGK
jgi:hypothetical protein